MLGLKRLAVTGGLSCGKTLVCCLFKDLGAYVVSADEIAHRLLSPDTIVGKQVIRLLGSDIVVDNNINRRIVASKVFKDTNLLKSLEQITHPVIRDEIENKYQYAL